jgi:hypothetical protein
MRARREINRKEEMTRNLKALGLALVAVCAMGAVMASAASAQGKLTSTGPFTLVGEQTPGEVSKNQLGAFGSTVHCKTAHFTGHKSESTTTPKELLASGATAATVTGLYGGCTDGTGRPATVSMTDCDYTLTLGAATAGGWGVSAQLQCKKAGEEAHVEVFNDAAHKERLCTITFAPQTPPVSHAHLFNGGGTPDDVNLVGSFTGIVAKREGLCLLDGKGTNTTTATLSLDLTVKARNAGGGPTDLTVS